MASTQYRTIGEAIDLLLSGQSVLVPTDVALQHGLEQAIQFHTSPHESFAGPAERSREGHGEERSASTGSASPPCEFTC